MKKRIIFVLLAVLAVSFSSTSYAGWKKLKEKAKDAVSDDSGKKDKKKAEPVSKDVILVKGLQILFCGNVVKDDGSITVNALTNGVTISVKKGKFDLTLPANPVFGDERELYNAANGDSELEFGSAKVYRLNAVDFSNARTKSMTEEQFYQSRVAQGRGSLGFDIYYSDRDVKGTINGEPASLKKGWNIVGDKNELRVSLMCAG